MRVALYSTVLLAFWAGIAVGDADRKPGATDSSRASIGRTTTAADTSALTGSGLNTNPWPIDRLSPGGVMQKLPGHRDWVFLRGITDAEMRQLGLQQQAELLRLHGAEPRDIAIAVSDSFSLRKLSRFGITSSCVPPCTLRTRVLYRDLPRLNSDSLTFWGAGDRQPRQQSAPAPHSASPRKPSSGGKR